VDETYVRVKGRWCYLYRAIDSTGATIDFLLSALRDADAAKRLFRKALSDRSHPQPRVMFKYCTGRCRQRVRSVPSFLLSGIAEL
jgi:transposase-like protein